MKWNDFFCLVNSIKKPILTGFACSFVLAANAEPPPPDAFNKKSELVLTLSDKWVKSNANPYSNLFKPNGSKRQQVTAEPAQSKPADIDCGMDVNPNGGADSSLTGRIVGECNFNYHY
ncbi:hypothetical protein [Methylomonas sp. MgM2]